MTVKHEGLNKNQYNWSKRPQEAFDRLVSSLYPHLHKMGISMNKKEREKFVTELLIKQKDTCYFADGDDRYCWNEPWIMTEMNKSGYYYLRLEWGHLIPKSQKEEKPTQDSLVLMCSRCNNNIQKSRTLEQLVPELEHKLEVIKMRLKEK